ncbi:MAG: hypothetical protein LQ346_008221 [Caloplaca aetnensis]|nr:MAG: hypothetical protein LQ346_008221 [Caloplaca aetnensis]
MAIANVSSSPAPVIGIEDPSTDGQPIPATSVSPGDIPPPDLPGGDLPLITNAPGPPSELPPEPENPDNCETECFIIYATVFVYFPPAVSSNTDCLTKLLPQPTTALPPGLTPESGNAYVVVPQLSAGNNCTKIAEYTSLTFTFKPGELSTIQGPANTTKEFNFADIPCPPSDVAEDVKWFFNPDFNPAQPYAPVVAPFPQLWDVDPGFKSCVVPLNQGFDPSMAYSTANGPTLPDPRIKNPGPLGGHFGRPGLGPLHGRGEPVIAHKVPGLPLETGSPGSRGKTQK